MHISFIHIQNGIFKQLVHLLSFCCFQQNQEEILIIYNFQPHYKSIFIIFYYLPTNCLPNKMFKCIFSINYSLLLASTSLPLLENVQLATGNDTIYCKFRKSIMMTNASGDSFGAASCSLWSMYLIFDTGWVGHIFGFGTLYSTCLFSVKIQTSEKILLKQLLRVSLRRN